MPRFRVTPRTVDAMQVPKDLDDEDANAALLKWLEEVGAVWGSERDAGLVLQTVFGDMVLKPGDWVVHEWRPGECYPWPEDRFHNYFDQLVGQE